MAVKCLVASYSWIRYAYHAKITEKLYLQILAVMAGHGHILLFFTCMWHSKPRRNDSKVLQECLPMKAIYLFYEQSSRREHDL